MLVLADLLIRHLHRLAFFRMSEQFLGFQVTDVSHAIPPPDILELSVAWSYFQSSLEAISFPRDFLHLFPLRAITDTLQLRRQQRHKAGLLLSNPV